MRNHLIKLYYIITYMILLQFMFFFAFNLIALLVKNTFHKVSLHCILRICFFFKKNCYKKMKLHDSQNLVYCVSTP